MKILLLSPRPANAEKERPSRSDAQLDGIASAARAHLSDNNGEIELEEVQYCTNDKLPTDDSAQQELELDVLAEKLNETDLLIDVSVDIQTNINKFKHAGPAIHLGPSFSGSFACNDIAVTGSGRITQADVVHTLSASRERFITEQPQTYELDADMHYSGFTPLPTRVGDDFYRSGREHALVFLSYTDHERDGKTRDTDKRMLASMLHTAEGLKSITFMCENRIDAPLVQDTADFMWKALGIEPRVYGLRRGEYHDMFSVMSKADLVFCGGNSLYADAILQGRPVYVWRAQQAGTEPISLAYTDYIEHRDRARMLREQRVHLDTLINAQYLDATLPNGRACFEHSLAALINNAFPKQSLTVPAGIANRPSWVIPEARLASHTASLPARFKRSVWENKVILAKFRKSPASYIRINNEEQAKLVYMQRG